MGPILASPAAKYKGDKGTSSQPEAGGVKRGKLNPLGRC